MVSLATIFSVVVESSIDLTERGFRINSLKITVFNTKTRVKNFFSSVIVGEADESKSSVFIGIGFRDVAVLGIHFIKNVEKVSVCS